MKKTRRDYIKIALIIAITAGMFASYIRDISPFAFIFSVFWGWDFESLFTLQIPLLAVIPLLMLLIFNNLLNYLILKVLKVVFLLIYIGTLVEYGFGFYDTLDSNSLEFIHLLVSITLSLILFLLSLKYSIIKSDVLEHLLIATMALPIFLYFLFSLVDGFENTNYGFYILNGSFITLYVISIYDIFKNRNLKKSSIILE